MKDSFSGFSLLEVLVAAVIMVMGIVGLLPAFNAGLKGSKRAKCWTEVALLAQRKLEELKAGKLSEFEGKEGIYDWRIEKELPGLAYVNQEDLTRYVLTIEWRDGVKLRHEKFVLLM